MHAELDVLSLYLVRIEICVSLMLHRNKGEHFIPDLREALFFVCEHENPDQTIPMYCNIRVFGCSRSKLYITALEYQVININNNIEGKNISEGGGGRMGSGGA